MTTATTFSRPAQTSESTSSNGAKGASSVALAVEAYQNLKSKYYGLLDRAGESKGDIRAFVGARVWHHEGKALAEGKGEYEAHVLGLEAALKDLKSSLGKGFQKDLSHALEEWRSSSAHLLPRANKGPQLHGSPIAHIKEWVPNGRSMVSMFTGAFGLDLGFLAAGFDLRFANDIALESKRVADANLPTTPFFHGDIDELSMSDVLKMAGLQKREVDVLVGGPPCQPFSTAGKRQGLNDPRSSPLRAFIRAITEIQPRAFVMEEVTGLQSARLMHVPIADRDRELLPEEKSGSVIEVIHEMFAATGYHYISTVLNAADYGAPQARQRLVFIGLRDHTPSFPAPTHARTPGTDLFNRGLRPWATFWEATADLPEGTSVAGLSENRKELIKLVPPGGHWRQLPADLIEKAMGGAYNAGGGKMGFYRRLSWDEPSPTVVTSPVQLASLFCHPEAARALSVAEYGRLQGFPDDWELPGSINAQYRLIGNAVPVHLSYAIARHVTELLKA